MRIYQSRCLAFFYIIAFLSACGMDLKTRRTPENARSVEEVPPNEDDVKKAIEPEPEPIEPQTINETPSHPPTCKVWPTPMVGNIGDVIEFKLDIQGVVDQVESAGKTMNYADIKNNVFPSNFSEQGLKEVTIKVINKAGSNNCSTMILGL